MRTRYVLLAAAALALTGACEPVPEEQTREVPAALEQFVLDDVPEELTNPTLVDFEGKVQLVGWEIEPEGPVTPGRSMKIVLYWKSVSPLGPGWSLFTQLVDERGKRVGVEDDGSGGFDDIGPLRRRAAPDAPQALGPSAWTPGKVYMDIQPLRVPDSVASTRLTVVVGIGREPVASATDAAAEPAPSAEPADSAEPVQLPTPGIRLRIVSGTSDGRDRAVVAHVDTTWKPGDEKQKPAPRAGQQRLQGRPPPGGLRVGGGRQQPPGARRMPPQGQMRPGGPPHPGQPGGARPPHPGQPGAGARPPRPPRPRPTPPPAPKQP